MKKQDGRSRNGGARPGAGNSGRPRVAEQKRAYSLKLHPSIAEPFRKKHGRKWGEVIEGMMKR